MDSTLISPDYLALQKKLHENPNYGVASIGFAPLVRDVLKVTKARALSDYGAGKQNLKKALHQLGEQNFIYLPYDPVFPEYGPAQTGDLAVCIDVLEHIEPDRVDAVIADLRRVTGQYGFFSVATGPAQKVLSDGRNAHLIQEGTAWWLPRLCRYFEIGQLQKTENGFWVFAEPLVAK
jgi:hypothetical protein